MEEILSVLSRLPGTQLVLLTAATSVWLIGANLLEIAHRRRVGKRRGSLLYPSWLDYDRREAGILGALMLATAVLGFATVLVGIPDGPSTSGPAIAEHESVKAQPSARNP